jgi:hypothetical protein
VPPKKKKKWPTFKLREANNPGLSLLFFLIPAAYLIINSYFVRPKRWVELCYLALLIIITKSARHQWLTPVILAAQEAEIRRIMVQSQPRQIVCETLSRKNPSQKRACGVVQVIGPEFSLQYHKKKKKISGRGFEVTG